MEYSLLILAAALTYQCSVCKVRIIKEINFLFFFFFFFQTQMDDPKTYKQHFESKHPKNELPAELKDV